MVQNKISFLKTRISVSLRDFGVKHTLLRMFTDGVLGKFFTLRKYIIYEKSLSQLGAIKLRNPDVKFLFISPDDDELLLQIQELSALSAEMVKERIKKNGECIVAIDKGKIAGFNLVSIGRIHVRYVDGYLNLSASEAWSEQITVAPEYRQSGLATDLRNMMFDRLAKRGYTSLFGGYVPFNVKSGNLAKKLGFIEREKVTLLKILAWKKLIRQLLTTDSLKALPLSSR